MREAVGLIRERKQLVPPPWVDGPSAFVPAYDDA
jgi:hypothetical protein